MTKEELEECRYHAIRGFCFNDKLNPLKDEEDKVLVNPSKGCWCDNCCEGNTKACDMVLKLLDYVESLQSIINQLNNNSHGTRKELPPV